MVTKNRPYFPQKQVHARQKNKPEKRTTLGGGAEGKADTKIDQREGTEKRNPYFRKDNLYLMEFQSGESVGFAEQKGGDNGRGHSKGKASLKKAEIEKSY